MRRIRTKRIVWTMAVLLVLSFIAAMVLGKHEEPKIVGNISPQDASEISRVSDKWVHRLMKRALKESLEERNISAAARIIRYYPFINVTSIKVEAEGSVLVSFGTKKGNDIENVKCYRDGEIWELPDVDTLQRVKSANPIINAAPVSR